MKRKILFTFVVFMIAASALAGSQRIYIAGDFREAVDFDSDQRKEVRDDKNIMFSDTVFADLDLDGLTDRISCVNGLQIDFMVADSTYRSVKLSDENGKIGVYDLNSDGLPDIIQQNTLFSRSLFYANTAIKALTPDMIPVPEDTRAYFAYNNYSDTSGINYYPSLDNKHIAFEIADKGLYLVPEENWFGTATLTIAYGKNNLSDTVHCPIVVLAVNDAPVVNPHINTLTILEDHELVLYKDSLLTHVSDADSGDHLTITMLDDRNDLFEEEDSFVYHPGDNWNGSDDLFFLVSDGQASDTLVQQIAVEAVNDAPQWTPIARAEFPEDELYRLPLTWFGEHASDVETPDSLLRFHVYSGSHVIISAEGGAITLFPDKNWFGDDVLTLTVSDGELIDTAYWNIRITSVNDAPELAMLPDTLFNEDELLYINRNELEKFAYDVETPSRDLKWQVTRLGKIRAYYNGERVRFTAARDWFGTDSLELTVSDGELSTSRIWRVHVLPVNDVPAFVPRVPPRIFMEDDTLIIKKESLYKLVKDAETRSQDLEWMLFPSLDIKYREGEKSYYIYAAPNWFGETYIRFLVNDGEFYDSLKQNLRVLSVNDKPVITDLPAETWNEDDTLSLDRSYLEGFAKDVETETQDLMWTFINDPNLKIKQRSNAITLIPDPDWNGDAKVGLIINDGGLMDTGYMDITIKPVNDAPRWKALPDTSIKEDNSMVLPLAYVKQFVYDPDKEDEIKLTYKAGDHFYVEDQNDTLTIWPGEDWFGKEKIEFTATDGKKKVKQTWTISVLAVNDPPYFTMDLPDSLSFRANSSDTLIFKDIIYDLDNKLEDLVWEITPGRIVRYMFNEDIGGIIFFTENYRFGEDAVTIRVTDGHDVILFYMPVYVHQVDRFLMSNPEKLELLPNTPNPFKDYTDIRYSLPVSAQVSIKIYNLLGKEIDELVNGYQDAQNYSIRWYGETESGMPAPSGVYLCRMVAVVDSEPVIIMRKMMLVR
ncbi:MAG: tandem-95 repeat protein [Candidatus Marinimicrobia bacterium]|nr:tandem-95 repeat protein [Candidatus Neomarinimicrobiota bacterium]